MADEKQAGPVLSFNNIALGGKSGGLKGQLKVTSSGFSWKAVTGKSITLTPSDVLRYEWTFVGPLYQLKLGTKGDGSVRFDGFREKDIEGLRTFISAHFSATVNVAEQALLGRNWGDIEFNQNGSSLAFKHQGKQLFEIPLSDVAQATLASKNDVAVEFHLDDTTAALEHDFLSEIRFYIPPDKKAEKAEGDGDKNAEPEQSAAEKFQKRILAKADVISYAGSGMVVFKDLTLVFPRGKYEVELYGTFLRLHGKSYDYKVLYSNIPRLFWLSRSDDDRLINVVVSLDQPIKQGQTRYPHLVFQFMKADEEMEIPVNLDEENARKYKDKLGKTLKGKPHDIFLQAFKALADKKVSASGAQGGFRSHDKRNAIKCSVKANEGLLYPLERSLFFIPKPPIHVHFDEIAFVEFSRVSSQGSTATTRNFDLIIALKGGSSHQFTNVMRQEFSSLCNYFKAKEVKIKGLNNVSTATAADSDEEGGGREARKAAQAAMREGAESDSDEEDDDFVAKDEDDVPEEYESGPESVGSPSESGSDEGSEKGKKKEKKKEKKDKEKKEKKKDKGEKKKEKKEKKDKGDKGDKKEEKKDKGEKKEENKDKAEKKEEKKDDGAAGDKRKHSDDEQKEGKKARKGDSDED